MQAIKTLSSLAVIFFVLSARCFPMVNNDSGPVNSYSGRLNYSIDSLVSLQTQNDQPGGVVAVFSGDRVIASGGYGLMDLEGDDANSESTIFDIASVAKQFTAYAIVMLENEGKLSLDENIRVYLPALPDYEEEITIRHLLQHTSGIASTDVLRLFAGLSFDEPWNQQDEYGLIMSYPQLNFKPGSRLVYSNAGYSLLAQIVESVSGMKFSRYIKENLFDPIQMNSAFVYDDPQIPLAGMAKGYMKNSDGFTEVGSTGDYSYGAGNIFASLNDMIKWGRHLFSAKTDNTGYLDLTGTPYNTLENGDTIRYTYGFYVRDYKGVRMVEHSGGVPGYRNQFMIFPEEGFAITLMFNNESINTRRLALDIAELMLAGKLIEEEPVQRVEVDPDPVKIHDYLGSFRMPDGMEMTFSFDRDTFWLVLPGDSRFQLFAESDVKFFLKAFNAQCTFVSAASGEVNQMIWHQGGVDYAAARIEERENISEAQLAAFAGNYIHKTLNAEYPVEYSDGKLIIRTPDTFKKFLGFDTIELNHISGDRFYTDRMGLLEFTRDGSGRLTGFVLEDVGRLRNVTFHKL